MLNWWKKKASDPKDHRPLIHEPMKWDTASVAAYETWLDTLEKKRILNQLFDAFLVFSRRGETLDDAIDFSDTPMHRGFIIHAGYLSFDFTTYRFLLEFFKDKLIDHGYHLALNDAMTSMQKEEMKTVYRYYLKPSLRDYTGGKRDQLFGNVKIELHVRGDRVHHLQCLSTVYSDRSYEPAKGFRELIEVLLLSNGK